MSSPSSRRRASWPAASWFALLSSVAVLATGRAAAAQRPATPPPPAAVDEREPWYERLSIRGYAQVRHNGVLRTNPALTCPQCDRALGAGGGLSLRRVRLILSGDLNDRVSIYVQPDFASDVDGTLHVGQLRDAYFDLALDQGKTFRLRIGQSKIPYGWENMQSSSNRIPLDRSDPINSALPNERDVAAIAYWAPARIRQRFRTLVDAGLKGSGDYGVVGVGVFNGQGTNRPDANDGLHTVARASYPFELPNGQFVEVGVQGYRGRYVLPSSLRSAGVEAPGDFPDARAAATFVLYPQPFGLQAEWNVGRGPEADPAGRTVRARPLDGGYVMTMLRLRTGTAGLVIPFVRAQRYDGGKKFERDARRYQVRDVEAGVEWLPIPAFELTAMYHVADRRYEDVATPGNHQRGRMLRVQVQFNY